VARNRQILTDVVVRGAAGGFTLIDMMVTVGCVAILSMLAYFSFGDSVAKSKRSECKAALMAVASAQEAYMTSNSTYASTLAALNVKAYSGNTAASSACLLSDPVADPNQPVPPVAGTLTSFIATATDQFTDSTCGSTWTINNLGQKTPDPATTPSGQCW